MKQVPVLLAGATPLVTALGVLLARRNWPVAGLWDPDHARALTSSLRIGCCAFAEPQEPLARAELVILGGPGGDWTAGRHELTVIATFPESGVADWLVPREAVSDPGQDLAGVGFDAAGEGRLLAIELGLVCSVREV